MRGNADNVRRSLARLRKALQGTSPQEIHQAMPAVAEAITAMGQIEQRLAVGEEPPRGLKASLSALKQEIGFTQQLVDYGLALYRNRAIELAALAGGYDATGLPSPIATGSTIRIEG